MTQQFTDDVEIQGDLDVDGNLRVGDDPGTTNAMIEAQREATSTTKPKRGLQTTGEVENENAPSNTLTWSNHEVSVLGASTDVAQVTALRASAQSSDGDVDSLVGIETNVDPVSGTVNEAVGINVPDVAGATNNYAIKTGAGKVHVGDSIELDQLSAEPSGNTGTVQLYARTDGKLYQKNGTDPEEEIGSEVNTASNQGSGTGLAMPKDGTDLPFKTLVAGPNITLTPGTDTIQIEAADDSGEVNAGTNLGSGANVYAGKSGTNLQFRRIQSGGGVTVATSGDSIQISNPNLPGWEFLGYASESLFDFSHRIRFTMPSPGLSTYNTVKLVFSITTLFNGTTGFSDIDIRFNGNSNSTSRYTIGYYTNSGGISQFGGDGRIGKAYIQHSSTRNSLAGEINLQRNGYNYLQMAFTGLNDPGTSANHHAISAVYGSSSTLSSIDFDDAQNRYEFLTTSSFMRVYAYRQ